MNGGPVLLQWSFQLVTRCYELCIKVYIQKFLIWASNKADFGYGKYIFFHTDYSSDRKEPLKRDIKVAASVEKIREFMEKAIAENIKKNYIEI